MAGRFVCNLVHFVWSTSGRREWLSAAWRSQLYAYLGGIANNKRSKMLAAGGVADHIHVFVSMPPNVAISDMANALKANSSRWIHDVQQFPQFRWQEGYGAFSVSRSNEKKVMDYIAGQEEHHRQRDFKAEFIELLARHQIEYDPKFIWQ